MNFTEKLAEVADINFKSCQDPVSQKAYVENSHIIEGEGHQIHDRRLAAHRFLKKNNDGEDVPNGAQYYHDWGTVFP